MNLTYRSLPTRLLRVSHPPRGSYFSPRYCACSKSDYPTFPFGGTPLSTQVALRRYASCHEGRCHNALSFEERVARDSTLLKSISNLNATLTVGRTDTPIVVILGWAGSVPRQVARYTTLHRDLHQSTVLALTAPVALLFQPWNMTSFARNLLAITETLLGHLGECSVGNSVSDLSPSPSFSPSLVDFFLHIFSNGGGFIYTRITALLCDPNNGDLYPNLRRSLRGVILDSAPAVQTWAFRYKMFKVRAFSESGWWVPYLHQLIWPLTTTGCFFGRIYLHRLIHDPLPTPQLYLYSDIDLLTDATELEKYLLQRRQHCPNVHTVKFFGSQHVNHMATYPMDYRNSIRDFILLCQKQIYKMPWDSK